MEPAEPLSQKKISIQKRIVLISLPLLLLAAALLTFSRFNPIPALTGGQPPAEEISVERVILDEDGILLFIVNGGHSTVVIAQVLVDEAYWSFTIEPGNELSRLARARVRIPYHWVEGELHEIVLLTSTGTTFGHTIEVAVASPPQDSTRWFLLAAIGFLVGIVPVGLGLMWFPLLQGLRTGSLRFVLSLTVGLLIFLFFDTLAEAIEFAGETPGVFKAIPLLFVIAMMSYLALMAVGNRKGVRDRSTPSGRYWVATAIAIGIGVHNLGEGLAVGASIAAGEAALGSFLIVGFVLHNVTEGVGIGAPMAQDRIAISRLAGLTLIAGGPAIIGTWLGGFTFTPLLAVIFFAIGAGAILQVIVEVSRLVLRPLVVSGTGSGSDSLKRAPAWSEIAGVAVGVVIMYATALLV